MNSAYTCPKCSSPYGYEMQALICCPECGNEWSKTEEKTDDPIAEKVVDANGNQLLDGDDVIVVKDLPVKGAPKPIKAGTKVKNIRLVTGDHNIDCKIPGFGAMGLKSIFVKKTN